MNMGRYAMNCKGWSSLIRLTIIASVLLFLSIASTGCLKKSQTYKARYNQIEWGNAGVMPSDVWPHYNWVIIDKDLLTEL